MLSKPENRKALLDCGKNVMNLLRDVVVMRKEQGLSKLQASNIDPKSLGIDRSKVVLLKNGEAVTTYVRNADDTVNIYFLTYKNNCLTIKHEVSSKDPNYSSISKHKLKNGLKTFFRLEE